MDWWWTTQLMVSTPPQQPTTTNELDDVLVTPTAPAPVFSTATADGPQRRYHLDQVVRVLDDGSVKLRDAAIVSLADVRLPINSPAFPTCLAMSPVAKLGQLLPTKTMVRIDDIVDSPSSSSHRARRGVTLTRDADQVVINDRLVELGYATVSTKASASLQSLQAAARAAGRGIYQSCDSSFQAQFDDDRLSGRIDAMTTRARPKNPGDRVGCSDFTIYEDALKYYETYYDWYGDVARLDRNGDGIPCPGLPHTTNAELYRLKKPSTKT
jgi:hypothetical protein